MVTKIIVNIGSGYGLLPDGTKPLPDPMLTSGKVLWYSHESNFTVSAPGAILYNGFENYTFKITATSLRS